MADVQKTKAPKKRISFLMPYIDFCFMLIIIFIGMLSIAYFEPLGATDIETSQVDEIDNLEGQFQQKPTGVQKQNIGLGLEEATDERRPLEGSGQINVLTAPRENDDSKLAGGAAETAGSGGDRELGRGDDPQKIAELEKTILDQQKELDLLREREKELQEKLAGLEILPQTPPIDQAAPPADPGKLAAAIKPTTKPPLAPPEDNGHGNHFYLDLREKNPNE